MEFPVAFNELPKAIADTILGDASKCSGLKIADLKITNDSLDLIVLIYNDRLCLIKASTCLN